MFVTLRIVETQPVYITNQSIGNVSILKAIKHGFILALPEARKVTIEN